MQHISEHDEQMALFKWSAHLSQVYPELGLLFAIPNGGKRDKLIDICLPVARQGWHGLFIELKAGKNKPTAYQLEWLDRLAEQGYLAVVCYGWQDAVEVIKDYLEITGVLTE
jgi:hypothetical protein